MPPVQQQLQCRPLDTYKEIFAFASSPPAWHSLCVPLQGHSERVVRNCDLVEQLHEISLERPAAFCHVGEGAHHSAPRHDSSDLPKTLVCHDMANGYHDDSMIEGTDNASAYTFYNWAAVDVFCYFSHHLVTIPPLAWINAAHKHGCKVIGTLITEWSEGEQFWAQALSSDDKVEALARALAAIAELMGFDGWLLNVENKVSKPDKLLSLVRALHAALHAALPHAQLIWYDSVTVDGALHWQNRLNDKNRAFFDACDGLFTNYSWSVADVGASASAAGSRRRDVYIGLDVWGRNFYGGGMFNLQKAVKVVHSVGCSLAIFAPAWTHEALSEDSLASHGDMTPYEVFLLRDRALWGSIWPYLNTRLPSSLPFQTSFCRGHGYQRYLYGQVISPAPWYNLRLMEYQPNSIHGPHGYELYCKAIAHRDTDVVDTFAQDKDCENRLKALKQLTNDLEQLDDTPNKDVSLEALSSNSIEDQEKTEIEIHIEKVANKDKCQYSLQRNSDSQCFEPYFEDCFNGGSCLKVISSAVARLFHCDLYCEGSMVAVVVTKRLPGYPEQYLDVHLSVTSADGSEQHRKKHRVVLSGQSGGVSSSAGADGRSVRPASGGDLERLRLRRAAPLVPGDNRHGWTGLYYTIQLPQSKDGACARVTAVSLRIGPNLGPILLGHFGLCAADDE